MIHDRFINGGSGWWKRLSRGILLNSIALVGSQGCVTMRILIAGGSELKGIFDSRAANLSALNGCLSRKESNGEERSLAEDRPDAT